MRKLSQATIYDFEQMLKRYYENKDLGLKPLAVIGHKGLGKTATVKRVASELGIDYKLVNLEAIESPDFSGHPYRDGDVVKYARPPFLPKEGKGILFLDEFNRCNKDIRSSLLSLLEGRQINCHTLGEGWVIVLAGNPTQSAGDDLEEAFYETNELDSSLSDRLAMIELVPSTTEWLSYMEKKYSKNNPVVRFVQSNPSFLDFSGIKPTSPRSLEYAAKKFQIKNGPMYLELSAEIGRDAATVLYDFYENLDKHAFVQDYNLRMAVDDNKEFIKRTKAFLKDGNLAPLNSVIDEIIAQAKEDDLTTFPTQEVVSFLKIVDKDMVAGFLFGAYKELGTLKFTAFTELPKLKEFINDLDIELGA